MCNFQELFRATTALLLAERTEKTQSLRSELKVKSLHRDSFEKKVTQIFSLFSRILAENASSVRGA